MGPIRRVFRPLRRSRRQIHAEVDEEIRFHLEARAEQLARRGLPSAEARREAAHRFGDLTRTRDALRASTLRREGRMRRREWIERLGQDLGYALRQLRRAPGFTAVAVATLAVGIAANAVMFGFVDRLLLRPPPHVVEPERVHRVHVQRRLLDGTEHTSAYESYFRWSQLRAGARGLGEVAGVAPRTIVVGRGADAEEVRGVWATPSLFPLLGVRPLAGRFFVEDEDRAPDGTRVVVLGHGLWQRRFGGDAAVLGTAVRVGAADYTVVGVAPPGFAGLDLREADLWFPATTYRQHAMRLADDWTTTHNMTWITLVARPRPGVPAAQLQAALRLAYERSLAAEMPERPMAEVRPRILLAPAHAERGPDAAPSTRVSVWLLGVAATVLLVACANVANLLLARAVRRRREIAVRLALGVSRARLVGQLLLESLLLALAGAAVGLLLTHWAGAALQRLLLPEGAWDGALHDGRVLAFTLGAAVLTGVLAGLVPALQASRPDVAASLKAGVREGGARRSRFGGALLVLQAALSVVLLVGAGLFVRSLQNARAVDLGFDAERLVVTTIEWRGEQPEAPEAQRALEARLLARLRALPGVERATTSLALPWQRSMTTNLYRASRDSVPGAGDVLVTAVGTDHFATMGTRVVRGRALDARDGVGAAPAMVVSASLAARLWPAGDAVGQCLRIGRDSLPCGTIVGVAQNVAHGDLAADAVEQLWVPEAQAQGGGYTGAWAYVARVRGDAAAATRAVREALQAELPGDAYARSTPFGEIVAPSVRSWQLGATMFVAFGALSLLIAAVGLYGVIAYHVSQRAHEMGVRQALGARGTDLARLVLGEGARVAAAGLAVGTLLALAGGRWVAPLLYGVSPRDPLTYGVVVAVLLAVALLASLVPARRAARVAPAEALRGE